MSWSMINCMLLIITLIAMLYVWYTQPFAKLEKLAREKFAAEETGKQITDNLVEAIVLTNEDGIIIKTNKTAEKMFRYPRNSLIGVNVLNLIPEKLRQRHMAGIMRLKEGGEPRILGKTIDVEGVTSDNKIFPVALSLSKVITTNGVIYVGVMRDITYRTQIQSQINQLNQALQVRLDAAEAFNRSVSHDLNAPMRSINGFSEILEQDYGKCLDDKGRDYIQRIRRAVTKTRQLIQDMQKLAIVTQPDTELKLTEISLSNMFKMAFSDIQMSDPQRQVQVIISEDMKTIADPSLLGPAITNLVDNAWKYTSKTLHAVIQVGCISIDNELVYYIKDNGVGFDQSKAKDLFMPFGRLHPQTEFEGSGIGLTIVKRVIDLHKGKVWAKGIVGKGATFYFTLGTQYEQRTRV